MNTSEHVRTILGVEGRAYTRHVWPKSTRPDRAVGKWSTQTWGASRAVGTHERLSVELRFDDNCRNGKHSFAITGELRDTRFRGDRGFVAGGCLHEEIAKVFPELVPLIPFHLFDEAGPMHYIANTVYLAGDRDHNGLRKGEKRQLRNGKTGALSWHLIAVDANGEPCETYQLPRYHDGDQPPPVTHRLEWHPWCRIGEGKARELDAARAVAVWPEATDEELSQEPDALRAVLEARLPALVAGFRHLMTEVCGFAWEVPADAPEGSAR